MVISALLLLFVAGIGLTQAVSNPTQVTLRWLRLGGLINLALLAVAVTFVTLTDGGGGEGREWFWLGVTVMAAPVIGQLMAAQLGRRRTQRAVALLVFVAPSAIIWWVFYDAIAFTEALPVGPGESASEHQHPVVGLQLGLALPLSAGLLGGFLMTMLLGHAYLTAGGEMTQKPFLRLVRMLAVLLAARLMLSAAFGLYPLLTRDYAWSMLSAHDRAIVFARYFVGFAVPAVFVYMIHDCVKRRSNQSATGILYVATVLIIIGEAAALTMLTAHEAGSVPLVH